MMKLEKNLVKKMLWALLIGIFVVGIIYCYIDRPLAFWIEHHSFGRAIFKPMSEIATLLEGIAFMALIYLTIRMGWKALSRFQKALFTISLSISTAFFMRTGFKILFGRYWPATWIGNNPSLLKDNAYGFHFFHAGSAYESFPSGHSMTVFATATAVWHLFPKWRWCALFVSLMEVIGLLGMNYHFLGDIVAGALIGSCVGI